VLLSVVRCKVPLGVGLVRTISIQCIYGSFGREITNHMVIICIQFMSVYTYMVLASPS